jgi:uncharacterized protein YjdB
VRTQLSAVAYDAAQNPLTGRAITWSTSNAAVATVDANGMASAVGPGTATITATADGKSGTATDGRHVQRDGESQIAWDRHDHGDQRG